MPQVDGTKIKLCDFCTGTERAKWSYEASEFVHEDTALHFANAWLACDECSRLIDEEDMKGLMERALETFCKRFPEKVRDENHKQKLRHFIYEVHLEFLKKRTQWRKEPVTE